MNFIIAEILRNQAEALKKGCLNPLQNLHLIERVLPDGLPGNISYVMVMKELEKLADKLESEE